MYAGEDVLWSTSPEREREREHNYGISGVLQCRFEMKLKLIKHTHTHTHTHTHSDVVRVTEVLRVDVLFLGLYHEIGHVRLGSSPLNMILTNHCP